MVDGATDLETALLCVRVCEGSPSQMVPSWRKDNPIQGTRCAGSTPNSLPSNSWRHLNTKSWHLGTHRIFPVYAFKQEFKVKFLFRKDKIEYVATHLTVSNHVIHDCRSRIWWLLESCLEPCPFPAWILLISCQWKISI